MSAVIFPCSFYFLLFLSLSYLNQGSGSLVHPLKEWAVNSSMLWIVFFVSVSWLLLQFLLFLAFDWVWIDSLFFQLKFLDLFLLFYLCECSANMSVWLCITCVPGALAGDGPPCGYLESNLGPLLQQEGLFTTEPTLQPFSTFLVLSFLRHYSDFYPFAFSVFFSCMKLFLAI